MDDGYHNGVGSLSRISTGNVGYNKTTIQGSNHCIESWLLTLVRVLKNGSLTIFPHID